MYKLIILLLCTTIAQNAIAQDLQSTSDEYTNTETPEEGSTLHESEEYTTTPRDEEATTNTLSMEDSIECPNICMCSEALSKDNLILTVDCSYKDLIELPSGIDKRVTCLILNGNQLEEVPQEISQFDQLEELNINDNLIAEFALGSVSTLPKLRVLKAARNRLTTFPQELKNGLGFKSLHVLDLGYNELGDTLTADNFSYMDNITSLIVPASSHEVLEGLCHGLKNLELVCVNDCSNVTEECAKFANSELVSPPSSSHNEDIGYTESGVSSGQINTSFENNTDISLVSPLPNLDISPTETQISNKNEQTHYVVDTDFNEPTHEEATIEDSDSDKQIYYNDTDNLLLENQNTSSVEVSSESDITQNTKLNMGGNNDADTYVENNTDIEDNTAILKKINRLENEIETYESIKVSSDEPAHENDKTADNLFDLYLPISNNSITQTGTGSENEQTSNEINNTVEIAEEKGENDLHELKMFENQEETIEKSDVTTTGNPIIENQNTTVVSEGTNYIKLAPNENNAINEVDTELRNAVKNALDTSDMPLPNTILNKNGTEDSSDLTEKLNVTDQTEKELLKLQGDEIEEVKVGATSIKQGGGVDNSVIALIVAGMVIVVAGVTIIKNWNSIRNRFRPRYSPPAAVATETNGVAPEEVPLQDKSMV